MIDENIAASRLDIRMERRKLKFNHASELGVVTESPRISTQSIKKLGQHHQDDAHSARVDHADSPTSTEPDNLLSVLLLDREKSK